MTLARAIGLMSGTSMDGIDLAMLRTDGERRVERGPSFYVPYDSTFRRRLEDGLEHARAIVDRGDRPGDLAALERDLTDRHADAVRLFLARVPEAWAGADVIGFHGQTVLHRPRAALTVQIGDGERLARSTGLAVVYDMRANDMLHGGQGAPLVPVYHAALAHCLPDRLLDKRPVAFVNIGGISNITYVGEAGDPIAFDSGPGNALIDQWVAHHAGIPFDANGAIASEGQVVEGVLRRYLDSPFFGRPGPKSLDRHDFTLDHAAGLGLSDGARTLAALAAEAVLASVEHLPAKPKLWIVCGGGRKNPLIVRDLRAGAVERGAELVLAEEAGLDGDALEAEAWAYLAVRSLNRLPLTFPTTTGCRSAVSGGVLVRP